MKHVLLYIAAVVSVLAISGKASAFDALGFDIAGWGKDAETFDAAVANAKDDANKNCGRLGVKSIEIESLVLA
jgi:hypothetical protein